MSKTVLITGATKGIGRAVCERLLYEGLSVVMTYGSDDATALRVYNELNTRFPSKVELLKADISDLGSIDTIVSFLSEKHITLHGVIFNAGMTDRSDFLHIDPVNWQKVFTANVHFPVFLLQRLYPTIETGGCVVFTGSLMAIHPHSVSLAYGVSKSSVHALVKNLVKFFADKQIRVNGVAPGFVDTEWQKTKPAEIRENINRKLASGRFSTPEEITDIYWLLIHNASMNGEIVVCDGGYSFK
jgi:3-oxoacyl-[acyl-carrier protein] reductase